MTGLIGWWPLNENSGKARDLSGNGNHGTVNGATQGTAGKGGLTAYSFNGSGDSVDLESFNFGSIGSGNFTISLWFKSSTAGNSEYTYSVGDFSNWDDYIILRPGSTDESNPPVTFRNGSSGQAGLDPGGYADGNWHHYVVTRKGDSAEVFVDGTAKDTNTDNEIAVSPQTSNEGISPRGSFPGKISALRIYNRALSPQEIQTLYEWGSGDYASPPGTRASGQIYIPNNGVSYYNFSNPNNDTSVAKDQWNSNDGTVNGATYISEGGPRRDGAYSFSGSEYINLGQPSNLDFSASESFTVTAWFKPSSLSNECIVSTWPDSPSYILLRVRNGDEYNFGVAGNGGNSINIYPSINGIETETWNFICGTWDGASKTGVGYYNGASVGTQTNTSISGDLVQADWNIGRRSNGKAYFNGSIDDLRIYDRALSPSEVFQLYQWGTRGRDMRKLTFNSRGDQ